nr:HU family DNA-binding protein [Caldicoprobacter algeriensis]
MKKNSEYAIRIYFKEGSYMNKAELIAAVAERSELTKKEAESAINALISVITEALARNEKVQLVGFGTFEVRERAERKGRNPQTKEEIIIPASKAPVFKAGKALKDAVQ